MSSSWEELDEPLSGVALYDYDVTGSYQLPFEEGQKIVVTAKREGWWKGYVIIDELDGTQSQSSVGILPASYVQIEERKNPPPIPQSIPSPPSRRQPPPPPIHASPPYSQEVESSQEKPKTEESRPGVNSFQRKLAGIIGAGIAPRPGGMYLPRKNNGQGSGISVGKRKSVPPPIPNQNGPPPPPPSHMNNNITNGPPPVPQRRNVPPPPPGSGNVQNNNNINSGPPPVPQRRNIPPPPRPGNDQNQNNNIINAPPPVPQPSDSPPPPPPPTGRRISMPPPIPQSSPEMSKKSSVPPPLPPQSTGRRISMPPPIPQSSPGMPNKSSVPPPLPPQPTPQSPPLPSKSAPPPPPFQTSSPPSRPATHQRVTSNLVPGKPMYLKDVVGLQRTQHKHQQKIDESGKYINESDNNLRDEYGFIVDVENFDETEANLVFEQIQRQRRVWSNITGTDQLSEGRLTPALERELLENTILKRDCPRWANKKKRERRESNDNGRKSLKRFQLIKKSLMTRIGENPVTRAIRHGVPPEYREVIWWLSVKGDEKKKNSIFSPSETYEAKVQEAIDYPPECIKDIEKDLYRTFPSNSNFKMEEGIDLLRRVLTAYSVRNRTLGYCQSMNFIVALLLLHMNEERSFWSLCCIIEDIMPSGYYSSNMKGLKLDQASFLNVVQWKLPRLWNHLQTVGVQLEPITCSWFLCIFINTLPLETTLRVWDCFLHEGPKILFRVGIALLKLREPDILATNDFGQIYLILTSPGGNITSRRLLSVAYGLPNFSQKKIDEFRELHRERISREVEESERIRAERKAEDEKERQEEEKKRELETARLDEENMAFYHQSIRDAPSFLPHGKSQSLMVGLIGVNGNMNNTEHY